MPSINDPEPERVALYLRVSSPGQREVGTIETQRHYFESYADVRDFEVVGTYADDGVPGAIPCYGRARGRTLLEDAKARKFDSVVCCKLDRTGSSRAQGYISEGELDVYLADLRTQTDNLELWLRSVGPELSWKHQQTELAASTEAWLMGLQERIHEVEGDSEEAFRARHEIVRLLVDGLVYEDRRKDKGPGVRITYRFDEPSERREE